MRGEAALQQCGSFPCETMTGNQDETRFAVILTSLFFSIHWQKCGPAFFSAVSNPAHMEEDGDKGSRVR